MNQPELGEFSGTVGGALLERRGLGRHRRRRRPHAQHAGRRTIAVRLNLSVADYPGLTDYVNLYVLDGRGPADRAERRARSRPPSTPQEGRGRRRDLVRPLRRRAGSRRTRSTRRSRCSRSRTTSAAAASRRRASTDSASRTADYENGSIQLEPSTRDALLGALEMNLDLGFATLTSSTSYYDHSGDSTSENTGFYAQAGFLSFYYNYPRPMASAVRTWSDRSLIEELRLVSDTGEKFDYVAGLWYQDQNRDAGQDSFLRASSAGGTRPTSSAPASRTSSPATRTSLPLRG
jgi:hypothetical protein